jgi:ParB family transcriptional regulator, chromosome partitioning protein
LVTAPGTSGAALVLRRIAGCRCSGVFTQRLKQQHFTNAVLQCTGKEGMMTTISLRQYHERIDNAQAGYIPSKDVGDIDIDDVIVPFDREPKLYDHESLLSLGQDIKARGQLQPIRVHWCNMHRKWVIIVGERRYRAIVAVGLTSVFCMFIKHKLTPADIIAERLVDNLLRANPDPLEIARGCQDLMTINAWTAAQVADHLHVSKSTVIKSLGLLRLPVDVQQHIETGALTPTAAYEVSKVKSHDQQRRVAEHVIENTMTCQETVEAVREAIGTQPSKHRKKPSRTTKRTVHTDDGVTITVSARRRLNESAIIESLQKAIDLFRSESRAA